MLVVYLISYPLPALVRVRIFDGAPARRPALADGCRQLSDRVRSSSPSDSPRYAGFSSSLSSTPCPMYRGTPLQGAQFSTGDLRLCVLAVRLSAHIFGRGNVPMAPTTFACISAILQHTLCADLDISHLDHTWICPCLCHSALFPFSQEPCECSSNMQSCGTYEWYKTVKLFTTQIFVCGTCIWSIATVSHSFPA